MAYVLTLRTCLCSNAVGVLSTSGLLEEAFAFSYFYLAAAALGPPRRCGGHGDGVGHPHQAVPPFFSPPGQEQHVLPLGNDHGSAAPFIQPCFIYSGTLEAQKVLSSF